MKNLKFLLPMLAFIFAIGMAFTAPDLKEEPKKSANDYILVNGSWLAIEEQDCPGEGFTCQVRIGENGPIYPVYDEIGDEEPKLSNSSRPTVINL